MLFLQTPEQSLECEGLSQYFLSKGQKDTAELSYIVNDEGEPYDP